MTCLLTFCMKKILHLKIIRINMSAFLALLQVILAKTYNYKCQFTIYEEREQRYYCVT